MKNSFYIIFIATVFYSCKSVKSKIENKNYDVVNVVLDTYSLQVKSAYLMKAKMKPQNHTIISFFKNYDNTNKYFDKCEDGIKDSIFNAKELEIYKTEITDFKNWNYKKISNSNIIKKLELHRDYSKKRYENYKIEIKDDKELYIRKLMLWQNENSARVIKLSKPYISSNSKYAFCFLKEANEGDFI